MPNTHKLGEPIQIKKIITDHTPLNAIIQYIPANSILLAEEIEPFFAIQAHAPFANDHEVKTKNERHAKSGKYSKCGTKMFKFVFLLVLVV